MCPFSIQRTYLCTFWQNIAEPTFPTVCSQYVQSIGEAIRSSWRCLSFAHPDLCNDKEVVRIALRPLGMAWCWVLLNFGLFCGTWQVHRIVHKNIEKWCVYFLYTYNYIQSNHLVISVQFCSPLFKSLWDASDFAKTSWKPLVSSDLVLRSLCSLHVAPGRVGSPWPKPLRRSDRNETWSRKPCRPVPGRCHRCHRSAVKRPMDTQTISDSTQISQVHELFTSCQGSCEIM